MDHRAFSCVYVDLQRTKCIKLGDQLISELKTLNTKQDQPWPRPDLHTRIREAADTNRENNCSLSRICNFSARQEDLPSSKCISF